MRVWKIAHCSNGIGFHCRMTGEIVGGQLMKLHVHVAKRNTYHYYNGTSGKKFIKITSVGMGAAKSNETW